MTRPTYNAERQAVYRWRSQLETHLQAIERLLAKRPQGRDAQYGELPELPFSLLRDWGLAVIHPREQQMASDDPPF